MMDKQCIVCLCSLEGEAHFHSEDGAVYCEDHAPEGSFPCGEKNSMSSDIFGGIRSMIDDAKKDQERMQAEAELAQMRAMLILLGNNTLAVKLEVAGLEIFFPEECNKYLIVAVGNAITQVENYLEGKENLYK